MLENLLLIRFTFAVFKVWESFKISKLCSLEIPIKSSSSSRNQNRPDMPPSRFFLSKRKIREQKNAHWLETITLWFGQGEKLLQNLIHHSLAEVKCRCGFFFFFPIGTLETYPRYTKQSLKFNWKTCTRNSFKLDWLETILEAAAAAPAITNQ